MKKLIVIIIIPVLFFLSGKLAAQVHYQNTTTNSTNSSAIGYGTVASGEKSFASGLTSTASGVGSTTLGIDNLAIGDYSITLGSNLKAAQDHGVVIGSGFSNSLRLVNNQTYSLMIGFMSQYPTLFIGTSPHYNKTGRIGIGNVTNPQAKLHIKADEGEDASLFLEPNSWESGSKKAYLYLGTKSTGISNDFSAGLVYHTATKHTFKGGDVFIPENSLGIGTDNTYGYALAVKGKILTDEVMVKHPDDWYDYVFNSNYKLQSLKELEKYIKQNKHLPDIPSGKEVKDNGIALAKMNGLLLKKIEELTLYIIQQQKILNEQQQRLSSLEQKIVK